MRWWLWVLMVAGCHQCTERHYLGDVQVVECASEDTAEQEEPAVSEESGRDSGSADSADTVQEVTLDTGWYDSADTGQ